MLFRKSFQFKSIGCLIFVVLLFTISCYLFIPAAPQGTVNAKIWCESSLKSQVRISLATSTGVLFQNIPVKTPFEYSINNLAVSDLPIRFKVQAEFTQIAAEVFLDSTKKVNFGADSAFIVANLE
jgi:hypothetical protein